MKTLKTIIDTFETFTEEHPQVYSFGYGPINNLQAENRQFPIVWVQNSPGKMYDAYTEYNFDIWILNSTNQDQENLEDVMSDTALLGKDLTTKYRNSDLNDDFEISDGVTMTPLTVDFDDILSGWIFDFTITVDNNYCIIPE